jgi:hypothetical protein
MTAPNPSDRSAAPGIIPDLVHVYDDPSPPAPGKRNPPHGPARRRNPLRVVANAVMGALRGDKYMVDAYPAAGTDHAAASDDAGTDHAAASDDAEPRPGER